MALFGSQDEDTQTAAADGGGEHDQKAAQKAESRQFSVLKQPRVTEKATRLAEEENVYTFNVRTDATKQEIKKAVQEFYDVTPVDVRTVNIPKKKIRQARGRGGQKSGGKKAYVKLAEDDSIEVL